MGVLSTNTKITATKLKELGFEKIVWGSPDFISYSDDRKRRNCKWLESHKCWDLFDDRTNDYWKGEIIYFPPGFDGYVTPFQGDWQDPKNPAGFAYITIDNRDDSWYELIKINDIDDINIAIAVMKKRMKELDKIVF
mgnify:CR=1 FL=1